MTLHTLDYIPMRTSQKLLKRNSKHNAKSLNLYCICLHKTKFFTSVFQPGLENLFVQWAKEIVRDWTSCSIHHDFFPNSVNIIERAEVILTFGISTKKTSCYMCTHIALRLCGFMHFVSQVRLQFSSKQCHFCIRILGFHNN